MVAPEFQLVNETTVGGYLNFMQNSVLPNGSSGKDVNRRPMRARRRWCSTRAALVQRLEPADDGQPAAGRPRQTLITGALAQPAVHRDQHRRRQGSTGSTRRCCMVMASPSYLIQK